MSRHSHIVSGAAHGAPAHGAAVPQCHPGPSAMLWQTVIPMGAVSSPVGPGSNIEPSKTADKSCHHSWQQAQEAVQEDTGTLKICLFFFLWHELPAHSQLSQLSMPPVPTYAIICLRIAPYFTHLRTLRPDSHAEGCSCNSLSCMLWITHVLPEWRQGGSIWHSPLPRSVLGSHSAGQPGGLWVSEMDIFCLSWFLRHLQGKTHHVLYSGRCHLRVLGGEKNPKHIRVTDR